MLICTACIAAAGLAGVAAAATGGHAGADAYPLPRAVVASGAIRDAIDRLGRTGEFRLEMPGAPLPPLAMQDQPQPGKCVAEYHPLEHALWGLQTPPTPDCPGVSAAARCIAEWFARWREDLSAVHEAWEDAYCYCVCCPEEGGFETTQDCTDAMIDVFDSEFQSLMDRYNAFDPAGCCPVERGGTDDPEGDAGAE